MTWILALIAVLAISGLLRGAVQSWQRPPHHYNSETAAQNVDAKPDQHEPPKTFGEGLALIWHKTWAGGDSVAFFTFILSVFSALLVVVAVLQIVLLIRAEHVATRTANAAKEAADIAKVSAAAYAATERAFIYPVGLKWQPIQDQATGRITWRIYGTWGNSGSTPTRNLRVYLAKAFGLRISDADDPFGPNFGMTDSDHRQAFPVFIGPKSTLDLGPVTVTGEDLAAVQRGDAPLAIGGVAAYESIFTGDHPHITKFSWNITEVIGNPLTPDLNLRIGTRSSRTNNCADEECTR